MLARPCGIFYGSGTRWRAARRDGLPHPIAPAREFRWWPASPATAESRRRWPSPGFDRRCLDGIGAHALRPGGERAGPAVEVDHRGDRIGLACVKSGEIGLRHVPERPIVPMLARFTQQFHRRRLGDHEAGQRHAVAERDAHRDQTAERMSDQMYPGARAANDDSMTSTSCVMEGSSDVRRSDVPPYPSRLVVTQRKRPSHWLMMGRHAAPVLHDPGTSTTVGPTRTHRSRYARALPRS